MTVKSGTFLLLSSPLHSKTFVTIADYNTRVVYEENRSTTGGNGMYAGEGTGTVGESYGSVR